MAAFWRWANMSGPYPTFRQLAATCRAQAEMTSHAETAAMLLALAEDYEAQAEAEEAFGRAARKAA